MKNKGTLLAGILAGIGIGLLIAPAPGKETRQKLSKKLDEVAKKLKEIDYGELKNEIEAKIGEIKEEIKDLNKEKALDIAKEKAIIIKQKIEELASLAKEKATPVVNSSIEELRKYAIKSTKEITKKLEAKDNAKQIEKKEK